MSENHFPRGSEWRQWDLHVHTPASFHWDGKKFDPDPDSKSNVVLVDEMIAAFNDSAPAVFALMDYWTFDGWFALKRRLNQPGAPKLTKKVFPGIELRLSAPVEYGLNAHVIFSDEVSDQTLKDFMSALNVELINRPLSKESLIKIARHVGADKLKHHGLLKAEVDSDEDKALFAGSIVAELNCDSYKTAISRVPDGQAIGLMPFDTSDGLSEVKWQEHYAYVLGLFKTSPIFESRNLDVRGAFVNEGTPGNKQWIKNFQAALGNIPRLVISGSDAHRFRGVSGDNNRRGYGDFPSNKTTWIKADPTFLGLLQAIKEPAKRSYIGISPPKLTELAENPTFYIDTVQVGKIAGAPTSIGTWLDGCSLQLNPDLVAIIGNKGSGKSAIADVAALLGNSKKEKHFTFLKKDRFRGKSGEPAKFFSGKLIWCDKRAGDERNLNENTPQDKVELVRYIPQGHFEDLCNDHVSGNSDAFERELRSVIFSHTDEAMRLGALDFDQLIQQQELSLRDRLNELRKNLTKVNSEISGIEDQLKPEVRRSLEELKLLKTRQIDEHQKIRPNEEVKPTDQLTSEQQEAATELEKVGERIKEIDKQVAARQTQTSQLARKIKAVQNIRERIRILERAHKQFESDTFPDFEVLGIQAQSLVAVSIVEGPLDKLSSEILVEQSTLSNQSLADGGEKEKLSKEQAKLKEKLNAPQLRYQQSLKALEDWTLKLNSLLGTSESPETLRGIEARITQISVLPQLLRERRTDRFKIAGDIFDVLDEQRLARARLFEPVQDLIRRNSLIRDDYKLQFQATLNISADSIASSLFSLIKQQSGEFRGEDGGIAAIKKMMANHDCTTREGILGFVDELNRKVEEIASGGDAGLVGISSVLRKEKHASDVYDLLFGLSFLFPRYSLVFQDTHIEQLSPGQRGALLLIFYLLVDKGRNPIILDQPEENLDNQTVVSLLVPVLTEAKKKRQIIMVTHNPNLAVVCDAEQIIYSSFDRKNGSKISYEPGAIENPTTNSHVVDVLEGTKPAFDNRRIKYH